MSDIKAYFKPHQRESGIFLKYYTATLLTSLVDKYFYMYAYAAIPSEIIFSNFALQKNLQCVLTKCSLVVLTRYNNSGNTS